MQDTLGASIPGTWSAEARELPSAAEPSCTGSERFGRVVGRSAVMRRIFPLCERLAQASLPLVIGGETGTGKELLAESIHESGPRKNRPFVVLDCTAIAPNLVESALFGHERGAFTGATEARKGVFEEADGGTLLLDEIGDLELELQAKLLRALERSEITRVGSTRPTRVDVRFIAATRRDLAQLVAAGRFRDDLYYRIAVAKVDLPPLRERDADVRLLAAKFHRRMSHGEPIPAAFLAELERHDWPGNVRELQNAVARYVALGDLAVEGMAPPTIGLPRSVNAPVVYDAAAPTSEASPMGVFERLLQMNLPLPEARRRLVADFEQQYIERALERCGGNLGHAAEISGVGSRYFRLLRARNRHRIDDALDDSAVAAE